jgi:hypothetical protein
MLNTQLLFCKEGHRTNYCYVPRSLIRLIFKLKRLRKARNVERKGEIRRTYKISLSMLSESENLRGGGENGTIKG